jgi:hypothetical protein
VDRKDGTGMLWNRSGYRAARPRDVVAPEQVYAPGSAIATRRLARLSNVAVVALRGCSVLASQLQLQVCWGQRTESLNIGHRRNMVSQYIPCVVLTRSALLCPMCVRGKLTFKGFARLVWSLMLRGRRGLTISSHRYTSDLSSGVGTRWRDGRVSLALL